MDFEEIEDTAKYTQILVLKQMIEKVQKQMEFTNNMRWQTAIILTDEQKDSLDNHFERLLFVRDYLNEELNAIL